MKARKILSDAENSALGASFRRRSLNATAQRPRLLDQALAVDFVDLGGADAVEHVQRAILERLQRRICLLYTSPSPRD